jgi:hypothetical protein
MSVRVALLALVAVILGAILLRLKTDDRLTASHSQPRKPQKKVPAHRDSSREFLERLDKAAALHRVQRAVMEETTYRRVRDAAADLMSKGLYEEAAEAIEAYPVELRSGPIWEERLSPLWREALYLAQAREQYALALAGALERAQVADCAGAAALLEQYAGSFDETPWTTEATGRAEELRRLAEMAAKQAAAPTKAAPAPPVKPVPPPEPPPPREPEPKKLPEGEQLRQKIRKAINRGVKYVLEQRKSNGAFNSSYARSYPQGPTALALCALLKCGADRNSREVSSAFKYLGRTTMRRTYSVSLYMLALEAKFEPHGDEIEAAVPFEEQLRGCFKRSASSSEKRTVSAIVTWLRNAQLQNGMWTYAGASTSTGAFRRRMSGGGDGSNTQFAVLALYAAHRLGVALPAQTVALLAETYLENQQKSGPAVESFPVPAADMPIHKLRAAEKKALRQRGGPHTVSVDELYGTESDGGPMSARGWGYSASHRSRAYLSMSCAGVCNLVLAKAVLERHSGYAKSRSRVDRAIRDGAGYIAENLDSCFGNPRGRGRLGWGLYYTLYSVERAGMLTLCEKFGPTSWYEKGAELLLELQGTGGSWGNCLEDTCFALLFLSRSTTPFIRTSGQIYTGSDLFPKKKRK